MKKPIIVCLAFIVFIIVAFGTYHLLGKQNNMPTQTAQNSTMKSPTVTIASTQQAGNMTDLNTWKTYTNSVYSLKYPSSWYAVTWGDTCMAFSDIPNPLDIPQKISPDNHIVIQTCFYKGAMQQSFAYTNGSTDNKTIVPFTINGYKGIRGNATSTTGLNDIVFLPQSPKQWVSLTNETDTPANKKIFDMILSTFIFK